MADVNTTIISTGSTTSPYASLALAEADDFGCTSGQSALCEYAEEMTDTTAVTINTTVPSSIEISVQSAYRHNGNISSGAVLAPSSSVSRILNIDVPVTIRHLRIDATNVTETGLFFNSIEGTSYLDSIFLHDFSSPYGIRVQYSSTTNIVIGYRCISCTQVSSGMLSPYYAGTEAETTFYFCTAYSSYRGFRNDSTMALYGCVAFGAYPASGGGHTGDYNVDNTSNSSYQVPGSNSSHNLTPANELTDPVNNDFSIKNGGTGTLIDLVSTTSYDAYFPDIAGNSKSGSYADCGAFEFVSGGGTTFQGSCTDIINYSESLINNAKFSCISNETLSLADNDQKIGNFLTTLIDQLNLYSQVSSFFITNASSVDSISFSDSISSAVTLLGISSDSIQFSDSVISNLQVIAVINEIINLSDTISSDVLGTLQALVEDVFNISPYTTNITTLLASVLDDVTITDDINIFSIAQALSNDVFNFSISNTVRSDLIASSLENFNLSSETLSIISSAIQGIISEALHFTISSEARADFISILSENIDLSDSAAKFLKTIVQSSDVININTETFWQTIQYAFSTENLLLNDQISSLIKILASSSEIVSFTDTGSVIATFDINITDVVNFAEVVSNISQLRAIVSDGINIIATPLELSTLPNGKVSIMFSMTSPNTTFSMNTATIIFNLK